MPLFLEESPTVTPMVYLNNEHNGMACEDGPFQGQRDESGVDLKEEGDRQLQYERGYPKSRQSWNLNFFSSLGGEQPVPFLLNYHNNPIGDGSAPLYNRPCRQRPRSLDTWWRGRKTGEDCMGGRREEDTFIMRQDMEATKRKGAKQTL